MLFVHAEKHLGSIYLRIQFAASGEVTALFGPSGAGKTSVLNMVAGLLRPDRGRIVFDGEVLFDSKSRIDLPTHKRQMGYAFQERRLFPHLTVYQNLVFGRWMSGLRRDVKHEQHVIDMLGIGHLLK